MTTEVPASRGGLPKFLRDDRFWKIAGQAIAVILVVAIVAYLFSNVTGNLRNQGIQVGFGFLQAPASFDIGETLIPYNPSNSFAQAIAVGFFNSLRVMILGIILASIVGLTVGIARLSNNWLVRQLATVYIEILRNTPVLLQLFFWYFAVFVAFPKLDGKTQLSGPILFTNRGIAIPWLTATRGTGIWLILLAIGILAAAWLWRWRLRLRVERGIPARQWLWAVGAIAIPALLALLLTQTVPFNLDFPRISQGLQIEGGLRLSPEFSSVLLGLTLYTGSFIAEIVRAGIQSVPKGQWEAARALGLQPGIIMRRVVLPQSMRAIVPPLTSQYLNLAKNSSLAIAVGYPDIYFVASTTLNQTGRAVEVMVVVIVVYLTISLTISLLMNLYNRTVQIKER